MILRYYLCSCGESRLPVSWCVGDTCDMAGSDEDHGSIRRPSVEDRGWSSIGRVLDDRTMGGGGWVTPCVVCIVHKEMRNVCFLVEPQNQGRRVSQFGHQNRHLWFGDLGIKITVTVSWFGPQN
jgi:hypothetical protein